MSTTEEEQPPSFSPLTAAEEEDGIGGLVLEQFNNALSRVSTVDEFLSEANNIISANEASTGATVATLMTDIEVVAGQAVSDGLLNISDLGPFFRWMYWDQGIENITGAMAANGQLYTYFYLYGLSEGTLNPSPVVGPGTGGTYTAPGTSSVPVMGAPGVPPTANPQPVTGLGTGAIGAGQAAEGAAQALTPLLPPPAAVTYPTTPPPASPTTPGGVVVKEVINKTTVVQVIDPNLSSDVANAVSKAIQAETQWLTQLVVRTVDQALGGLQPGQAKTAISRLNSITNQISAQLQAVADIQSEFPPAGTAAELAGIELQLTNLQATVSTLQAAIAAEVPTDLPTQLAEVEAQVKVNTGDIAEIVGTTVPLLAQAIQGNTSVIGSIDSKLTQDIEPELSTLKSDVTANSAKLALTTDECLAALCDGENNVIDPIKNGGATPSLLRSLGSLLGRAFEIGFAATLLDSLVTVLDAKVSLAAVVADTEMVAGWAQSAAGAITTDLSWAGGAYVVS